MQNILFMAGVLRQLVRPQKKALNQKAMELEAAREILAEVFGVRPSEVDDMLLNHVEKASKIWTQKRSGQDFNSKVPPFWHKHRKREERRSEKRLRLPMGVSESPRLGSYDAYIKNSF
jgi:lipid A disaccharide synthetase